MTRAEFTIDEGIKVQIEQLKQWEKLLKPEIYKDLVVFAQETNAEAKTGYDITRGSDLDTFVHNHKGAENLKGKMQILHFLKTYSKMSNDSWGDNERVDLHNYWKGQVMGICKVIEAMNIDIDCEYYLKNLL